MDELKRNQTVKITLKSGQSLQGEIIDFSDDRVMILIYPEDFEIAKSIKELDELKVTVKTHLGLKDMISNVISEFNSINCITIENRESVPIVQRREFVRVATDIKFKLSKGDKIYDCTCMNISAGGVAFKLINSDLEVDDEVLLAFPKIYFEKDIMIKAKIIKKEKNRFVAKYFDLSQWDEDRIVKYVFKTIVIH